MPAAKEQHHAVILSEASAAHHAVILSEGTAPTPTVILSEGTAPTPTVILSEASAASEVEGSTRNNDPLIGSFSNRYSTSRRFFDSLRSLRMTGMA